MEFNGAADFYFWEGVRNVQKTPGRNPDEYDESMFTFNNTVTVACLDAFKWGILLGQVLTVNEYKELITKPRDEVYNAHKKIVEDTIKEINIGIDKAINKGIIGNC